MVETNKEHKVKLLLENERIEQVAKFQFLGIWINKHMKDDVDVRVGIAKAKVFGDVKS